LKLASHSAGPISQGQAELEKLRHRVITRVAWASALSADCVA
jgi:hypothetical protein